MDNRLLKTTNDEGGTFTAKLNGTETSTAHVSPVPNKAPGLITAEPGTAKEEAVYYKSKDDIAGTVSGLTRDYTNLNGGVGQDHENGEDWESLQAAEYPNNIIDAIMEGFFLEHQTSTYVSTSSFTVEGNQTPYYTKGRIVRINGSVIVTVVSSSYSSPNTTVVTNETTVPTPITSVEIGIDRKGATDLLTVLGLVDKTTAQTLSGPKTMTSPILNTPIITTPTVRNFDGWIDAAETWTYASANTINVASGAASKYAIGDRIKFTQTTVKYGVIVAVADTLLTIAVNTDYVVTNAAISANYYSHEASPIGYPTLFNYTPTWASSGTQPTLGNGTISGAFSILGKICHIVIKFTRGSTSSNGTGYSKFSVPVNATGSQEFIISGLLLKLGTWRLPIMGRANGSDAGVGYIGELHYGYGGTAAAPTATWIQEGGGGYALGNGDAIYLTGWYQIAI